MEDSSVRGFLMGHCLNSWVEHLFLIGHQLNLSHQYQPFWFTVPAKVYLNFKMKPRMLEDFSFSD